MQKRTIPNSNEFRTVLTKTLNSGEGNKQKEGHERQRQRQREIAIVFRLAFRHRRFKWIGGSIFKVKQTKQFDVFLTVHHRIDFFFPKLPT